MLISLALTSSIPTQLRKLESSSVGFTSFSFLFSRLLAHPHPDNPLANAMLDLRGLNGPSQGRQVPIDLTKCQNSPLSNHCQIASAAYLAELKPDAIDADTLP
ncbi:hypothetical protein BDV09DRAFT_45595 [Aspergillus tetrazonus]